MVQTLGGMGALVDEIVLLRVPRLGVSDLRTAWT
jgi:hypothetical protein